MKPLYFVLLISACLILSCRKDFLNKYPLDSPSSATFFASEEQLDMAMNGAYTGLWLESSYNTPFNLWLDATTDISWSRGDFAGVQSIQSGNYTPESGFLEDTWSHMYQSISKCNNLLQNMHKAQDQVDGEKYTQIEAQARFLRSFYYFYLIELFGDVPWVTTMLPLDSAQLPKTPKKEIVNSLYHDLNFAAANLPATWGGSDEGRATKGAALTLKARLALFEGDYNIADSAAKAVMDEGIYEIYPNYGELFRYAGEKNSHEIIFLLPYLKGVRTNHIPQILGVHSAGATWSILVPTQRMVDIYACIDGKPIDQSPYFDPGHPFGNRDPRLDQSIIRQGTWFNHTRFDPHPDSTKTLQVSGGDTIRVDNKDITTYATFTGYGWRKYMDEADCPDNITSSEIDLILMRYAEVLLTYAEARIELNAIDQSVIDAINKVRQRPGVNMPPVSLAMGQEELRQTVRYERTVELAGEGFRLFDIRRWKYAEHVLKGNVLGKRLKAHWYDAITPQLDQWQHSSYANEQAIFGIISVNKFDPSKDYLWPIPQKAIEVNPNLK